MAANVGTTSAWCSLDACVAGNEEPHTLHPFKAKGCVVSSCLSAKVNQIPTVGLKNRGAEDTLDTLSNVFLREPHVPHSLIILISKTLVRNDTFCLISELRPQVQQDRGRDL